MGPLSSEHVHLLYVSRLLFAHEISISLPETQRYYHLGLRLSLRIIVRLSVDGSIDRFRPVCPSAQRLFSPYTDSHKSTSA